MGYQSLKLKTVLVVTAIFMIFIKLFTVVVFLKDDPTSFLVIKHTPSFANRLFGSTEDGNKYTVLISDENEIIGEPIYFFITSYLWWIVLVSCAVILGVGLYKAIQLMLKRALGIKATTCT